VAGAGDILVGAGSAREPVTCPRSRRLGTKTDLKEPHSEALPKDLVKFDSMGVHCEQLARTFFVRMSDTPLLAMKD